MPIDMGAAQPQHGTGNGTGRPQQGAQQASPPLPAFLSADEFIAGYRPHKPLIKAWDMKRGWLYSFTAPTGGAKTAIALAEAVQLAIHGHRVVFMAGENPDDVRARVILMKAKLDLAQLPPTLRFVDRTFNLADSLEHVRHEVEAMAGADFVAVDTSPAFQVASGSLEENSNPEAIRWAQRLREMTRLQGTPAVLALCHPIKRPQSIEECLPRGGGGFIAESTATMPAGAPATRKTTSSLSCDGQGSSAVTSRRSRITWNAPPVSAWSTSTAIPCSQSGPAAPMSNRPSAPPPSRPRTKTSS
jgi:hypothetical protein